MRRLRGLLVFLILGIFSMPAWASDFAIFGAYWNTQDFDHGLGGGIRWAPTLAHSRFDLEFRGTYIGDINHPEDNNSPDFDVTVIPAELGLSYNFTKDAPADFFLGGGGGYYFLDTNEGQIDDEVGYWATAGLKVGKPEGVNFYFETMYRWMEGTVSGVQSPGNPTLHNDVDIDLNGFAANAGIVWRW